MYQPRSRPRGGRRQSSVTIVTVAPASAMGAPFVPEAWFLEQPRKEHESRARGRGRRGVQSTLLAIYRFSVNQG